MKHVAVIDAKGKVLATYPIVVQIIGLGVTDEDYFKLAKENAVEDGLVSQDEGGKLTFSFVSSEG